MYLFSLYKLLTQERKDYHFLKKTNLIKLILIFLVNVNHLTHNVPSRYISEN